MRGAPPQERERSPTQTQTIFRETGEPYLGFFHFIAFLLQECDNPVYIAFFPQILKDVTDVIADMPNDGSVWRIINIVADKLDFLRPAKLEE